MDVYCRPRRTNSKHLPLSAGPRVPIRDNVIEADNAGGNLTEPRRLSWTSTNRSGIECCDYHAPAEAEDPIGRSGPPSPQGPPTPQAPANPSGPPGHVLQYKKFRSDMQDLYKILSPVEQYNDQERCKLFEQAVLGKELVVKMEGYALLQYAAQLGYVPIIQLLVKTWRVDVNMKTYLTESTPLLSVVRCNHLDASQTKSTVEALLECGAKDSVNVKNKDGNTPLFMAIRRRLKEVFLVLLNDGDAETKPDVVGNTILHAAAEVNSIDICEEIVYRADTWQEIIAAKNDDGQTAIHLAAMHESECLETIINALKNRCQLDIAAMHKPESSERSISAPDYPEALEWFSAVDSKGCTPLDIAAKAGQRATFKFMWNEMKDYSPAHIDVEHRKLNMLIEQAENDPSQWQKVTDAIRAFPKRMLNKVLVGDGAHGDKPSFQRLITASRSGTPMNMGHGQEEAVRAVLDKSLFSDNVIVTETLDGTNPIARFKLGVPCAQCGTNCSRGSNLAALCASDFEVWDHPAVTLWLNYKLNRYGYICLLFYCFLYWTFYGVVCGALEVAGNLNVTSDHLLEYNNDPRSHRISLGITAVILWSVLLILDLSDIFRFGMHYLKWFVAYFRLAVHLCFFVLLVTHLCGHNSQWVLASLFVICGAFRAMEVFSLSKWSGAYLITLWIIVSRELLKFLLMALLLILAFSMALRFAVQAERDEASRLHNTIESQSGTCVPVKNLLENDTNTTCVSTQPLTHMLASHLLGELENFHSLFFANFHSVARGSSGQNYGEGLEGYKLFTAVVYLAFLGLVVLLLVSVFVAQATSTYKRVHCFVDEMANYSSARLLTQTSTMLPMWFCCLFMRKCPCFKDPPPYVWTQKHCLQRVWQKILSVFATKSSSLIKEKESQRNVDQNATQETQNTAARPRNAMETVV